MNPVVFFWCCFLFSLYDFTLESNNNSNKSKYLMTDHKNIVAVFNQNI